VMRGFNTLTGHFETDGLYPNTACLFPAYSQPIPSLFPAYSRPIPGLFPAYSQPAASLHRFMIAGQSGSD